MTQIEEASVAGESPGRSDQQQSSGETARGESDPRLAVSRDAEAAKGSTAVAVVSDDLPSGSDGPEPAPGGFEAESGAESGARAEAEPEAEAEAPAADQGDADVSGVRDGERGEDSGASKAAAEPKGAAEKESGASGASGASSKGKTSEPGAEAEADAGEAADADRARADKQKADADKAGDDKADAAKAEGVSGAEDSRDADQPSVDQRTAVFRTVRPGASGGGEPERTAEKKDESKEKDEPKKDKDEPKKEEDGKGEPKGASGAADASDADDDSSGKPADRPTAAFGVLPEKSGKGDEKAVDRPTTAFKALGTPADTADEQTSGAKASGTKASGTKATGTKATGAKASGAASVRESDNERTSKFVPLRSPEDPAPPRPSAASTGFAASTASTASTGSTAPPASAAPAGVPEAERTRQQPLPPLTPDGKQPAPLDLLAQLTNTPPKPETPIRTVVRRVKIWTPLVVLLVIILGVVQALRPLPDPELKLTSNATYRFGGSALSVPWPDQGQSAAEVEGVGSLGTSGKQKPVPIASVTKVMTAYVVLKDHPLKADAEGPKIKIDAQAAAEAKSRDESRAAVKEGQTFTQHQLLQLLLINSSNNIARLLARWDAGSLEAFIKKMNDAAESLGMDHTTYTDPSGLKESTKSTAADQLKLAKAAMQSEAFRAVVATPNTDIPGLDKRIYNNNNLLVKPGVIGIKTGSSTPAGGALMWAAVRTIDGKKQRILGVVLEQRATTTLDASLQLAQTNSYKIITALQDALTSATVIKKGDVVGQVDDGLGGTTPVVATKDLKAVGWSGLTVDIKIGDGGEKVPHSAKAGTVVGEVTVGTGPGQLKAPVALQDDLSEPSFGAKLTRIS
ncbi:D-alanyl-D-alanine carboxypeptidase [Streptomyces sp. RKCA744]|uniref:D-alanyl-D-alanine carboxypeptidase family protein n=1 Tax=Streptomyces sp. RKCA744 TaxID=2959340 RepID=UPI0020A06837|nr:D-alanyl-D-alanine carboxypeptidase [Streptomyces sp. RKCA744]MCO8306364.1 D-alanyl-D-alanine carboxypeptidase [Streptomyces sp. RKCA744]